ncbi:MAG: DUF6504 family protein [Planctomycetota bacterium]
MSDRSVRQFISEPIRPARGTADVAAMARGEPGLPARFTWRGRLYTVSAVLETWKTSTREGLRPTGDLYLRRHWYRLQTTLGPIMTLYCQRQARPAPSPAAKNRWFLYTIEEAGK